MEETIVDELKRVLDEVLAMLETVADHLSPAERERFVEIMEEAPGLLAEDE